MKKFFLITGIIFLIIITLGGYFIHFTLNENGIYPEVYINNVDVSKMTKQQAHNKLLENFSFKTITFVHGEDRFSYDLEKLGYGYDIKDAVDKAWNEGRSSSFFLNFIFAFNQKYLRAKTNIDVIEKTNPNNIKAIFPALSSNLDKNPVDAGIILNNGIHRTPSQSGKKVDLLELEKVTMKSIQPNVDVTIEIPMETLEPKITTEQVNRVKGVIGKFSTTFNASDSSRTQNIKLAVSRINGKVLMPGESFSFNEATGPMSAAGGYKNAPVIIKGELAEGLGGGVCQVSSTLYNSLLYSGVKITQRSHHSIPSSYIPVGRDATVNYGALDLKFENAFSYPIVLSGTVSGNRVSLLVYGDTDDHKEAMISSEVLSRKPKTVKYIRDTSVPPGTQVVKFEGRDGVSSITYQIVNGEKKIISQDNYPVKAKEIATYDGKPVTASAPTLPTTPVPSDGSAVVVP